LIRLIIQKKFYNLKDKIIFITSVSKRGIKTLAIETLLVNSVAIAETICEIINNTSFLEPENALN
jgi:hypothetical protein